jgi:hypothetical protein
MLTKESEMSANRRSRTAISVFAAVLTLALSAPLAVNADTVVTGEDEVLTVAPVAAPGVAGTSGEDLRATRALAAERALLVGDIGSLQEERLRAIVAAAPSWDETSGYGAVEASRATIGSPATSTSAEQTRLLAAQHALQGGDLGSLQEDALLAVLSAAPSWDETSGYGSVEASRAANAIPVAPTVSTTQVPAGVRWAPVRTIAPASSFEASRVLAAEQALQSQDLGSLQEDALSAVVEASSTETDASVDEAPAPTAADLLAQFRAIELSLSQALGAVE